MLALLNSVSHLVGSRLRLPIEQLALVFAALGLTWPWALRHRVGGWAQALPSVVTRQLARQQPPGVPVRTRVAWRALRPFRRR